MNFNTQQQLVVNHKDGASAVISGAGSGKTTVLLGRIENLIENHNIIQKDIITISFTRNSANELKRKLELKGYGSVKVGTFHAICMDILFKEGFNLKKDIKEWECKTLFEKFTNGKPVDTKDILSFISFQKNNMITYNDDFITKESKYSDFELKGFYKAYENFKKKEKRYDLDDYLLECYKIVINNKGKYTWNYVLVDEHQDSNLVQNLLINEWCSKDNLMVIGDFRQAIYNFRGAKPELFMDFYKNHDNTKIINLDINYRSCKNIVEKSNKFIKRYYGDYIHYSDSVSDNKEDGAIDTFSFLDRKEESKELVERIINMLKSGIEPKEISILYRNNSHADFIECELKKNKIPYEISNGSSFFKRKEIGMIMSVLRLIKNVHDDEAFEIFYKSGCYPLTYCSNKTFDSIKQNAGKKNLSYYESFIVHKYEKQHEKNNVPIFNDTITSLKLQNEKRVNIENLIDNIVKAFKINTYIDSNYIKQEDIDDRKSSFETLKKFIKGDDLESFIRYVTSPIVIKKKDSNVINLMTIHGSKGLEFDNVFVIGIEDGKFPSEKSDIKEEARLMYVAVTRPKKNLYLSSILGSRFIDEYMKG